MALKADSMKQQFEIIQAAVRNATEEAFGTQNRVDSVSNVDDWEYVRFTSSPYDSVPKAEICRLGARKEREIFENIIDNYIKATTDHLVQLRTRRNRLAAINKLPVEVLRSVFSHVDLLTDRDGRRFISYTWVCRYWRSVLIEDPSFWTSFQLTLGPDQRAINPFIHEYLQRSNTAKLDFKLTSKNMQSKLASKLAELFAKDSHRIRRFWLTMNQPNLVQSIFSNKIFSSLQAFTYLGRSTGFAILLPVLVESDQLETLSGVLGSNFPLSATDQLAVVLGRIRSLSLDVYTPELLQVVLNSIHNSDKLQDLVLNKQDMHEMGGMNLTGQTILPELQYISVNDSGILEHLTTPKLSSLETECTLMLDVMEYPIFKEINFSSIKYLYLLDTTNRRGLHSFLGLDQVVTPGSLFSTKPSGFTRDRLILEDFEAAFNITDIASENCPRNYFDFKFSNDEIGDRVIELGFSALLPRMPNLTELYLLSYDLTYGVINPTAGILIQIPSVEKLIIQHGEGLETFIPLLNDPSACPRLKHLSYTMSRRPEDREDYGEDTGKALIECLKARQKMNGDMLKFVALGNCPPLPDFCLEELQSLGITVVTEI